MDNETLFYIFGIGLAVSAVVVSFLGLKVKGFPGKAFPVVVIWFAIFVGGATTFAVLHAKDEEKAKAAETEPAGEKDEEESKDVEAGEAEAEEGEEGQPAVGEKQAEPGKAGEEMPKDNGKPKAAAKGASTTLQLAADTSALAYDTKELSAKAGEVTIDFDNPSPIAHDVAIEKDGKEIAASELVTEGKDSVSAELEPGTYTFFCTVPGHAEAGMTGTLTVK